MAETDWNASTLFVGEGVVFSGTIHAPGVANINGTIKGEINAIELQIGPNGNVVGKVEAKFIHVRGALSEKIVCHEHILIHRSGSVSGELDYMNIEIEQGGQLVGKMVQHPPGSLQYAEKESKSTLYAFHISKKE